MHKKIIISPSVAKSLLPTTLLTTLSQTVRVGKCKRSNQQTKPRVVKQKTQPPPRNKKVQAEVEHVYVLELQNGRVYVGKTTNVERRLSQHKNGTGSEFTKIWKPTGNLLPRLGNLTGFGDGPERCLIAKLPLC